MAYREVTLEELKKVKHDLRKLLKIAEENHEYISEDLGNTYEYIKSAIKQVIKDSPCDHEWVDRPRRDVNIKDIIYQDCNKCGNYDFKSKIESGSSEYTCKHFWQMDSHDQEYRICKDCDKLVHYKSVYYTTCPKSDTEERKHHFDVSTDYGLMHCLKCDTWRDIS